MRNKLELYIKTEMDSKEEKQEKIQLLEEMNALNKKAPIKEGEILINTTHIKEHKTYIQIGFFIRNATEKSISIEQIPVKFIAKEGYILDIKGYKLKEPMELPSYSAMPCSFEIKKDNYPNFTHRVVIDTKLMTNE